MAKFPAPAEGIVLTHFIVASDVDRARRFYAARVVQASFKQHLVTVSYGPHTLARAVSGGAV